MSVGVVTGAGSGMGRACVDRLLGTVDHVVAVDLAAPAIDGAVGVACDVSDADAVRRVADEVAGLGSFACLLHAAGLSPTMADPRRIVEVNLLGTVHLLDAFEPQVTAGSVAVCFASIAAQFAVESLGDELTTLLRDPRADAFLDRAAELVTDPGLAYAWSKKGVQLEAARAAVRWGPRGGRVVSLSPGLIDTPMGRRELDRQPVMQEMVAQMPLGRFGTADELAAVAVFLASSDASYLTGVDVLVDGGLQAAGAVAQEGA